ncbi:MULTISPECIES: hypothetical protein [unclassified Microbacterium]|uniref:hypothetical protein n=1 Tax=unclassified Microbacterium TaxID=2609290 RepID=UPI000EA8F3B5|nr:MULTISPECIES: hypothetical protein [unclassified Microbacterium]MBT2485727.1 hypothetical protein [Microbacterium sp. ISL-108]RKN68495.1 hypothetical protein D7252_13490 [Microbacterium sp. CGR2]
MPPIHPALSMQQTFALIAEGQSVQNLMRDTVAAIKGLREPTIHNDAVFTLGSIGVEKLAKIMLGCAAIEASGRWPSKNTMQWTWGHDIESLVEKLFATAEANQPAAVATGYVATLIARVRESTMLPLLFATLSRYGRSGRFHYLDVLATDDQGEFDPPAEYWERLEREAAVILGGYPGGTPEEFEAFLRRVSATMAHELDVWWFVMHRLGVQGCFGELGKKMGWKIWEYGRPDPLRR